MNGSQVCGAWKCPECSYRRGHEEAVYVFQKLQWASSQDLPVLFVTVSDSSPTSTPMTLRRFQKAVEKFKEKVKGFTRNSAGYYSTLGINPETNRLHLHLLFFGAVFIPITALSDASRRAKLGNVWVDTCTSSKASSRNLANYFADNSVAYAHCLQNLQGRIQRIQPVSQRRMAPVGNSVDVLPAFDPLPELLAVKNAALAARKESPMAKKPSTEYTNPKASPLPRKPVGTFSDAIDTPGPITRKVTPRTRTITPGPHVTVTNPKGGHGA